MLMSHRPRVALATSPHLPDLVPDDHAAVRAMHEMGVDAAPAVWSDPAVAWHDFDAVVIRTCWGYYERVGEFIEWIDRLDNRGTRVLNPPAIIRWNFDKRYLLDLERCGVPIVPTRWVGRGARETLSSIVREAGWDDIVVKPAVSAGAHLTWRATGVTALDDERFASMVAARDVIVQPFVREVVSDGELSLVFFGGEPSHAVLKRPGDGDFRVQKKHGGSVRAITPDAAIVRAARTVVEAAPGPVLYARVDGCVAGGRFEVMELELIEPELFLAYDPAAASRFASVVAMAALSTAP